MRATHQPVAGMVPSAAVPLRGRDDARWRRKLGMKVVEEVVEVDRREDRSKKSASSSDR